MVFPLVGGFLFLTMRPVRIFSSGFGTSLAEPVAPSAWVFGGVLIFLCVATCIEALRRGSRADRILLCVSVFLTFWLMREFFALMVLRAD